MAGRGPAPKSPELQQHRIKKSGATSLVKSRRAAPSLPDDFGRDWKRLTRLWWKLVWHSPMANEYLDADVPGLIRLAVLVDQFNVSQDAKLMIEIRLQEARFGLSPVDRSRLQWEVAKGDEAARRTHTPERRRDDGADNDPRAVLRAVS